MDSIASYDLKFHENVSRETFSMFTHPINVSRETSGTIVLLKFFYF